MYSPLRIRYHLLQEFKQLRNVKFFILPLSRVGVFLEHEEPVDIEVIRKWLKRQSGFERYILADEDPAALELGVDIEEEARALGVDLDELMDQQTNEEGFTRFLSKQLNDVNVRSENRFSYLAIYLPDDYLTTLSEVQKNKIQRLSRLLLFTQLPLEFRPSSQLQRPHAPHVTVSEAERLAKADRELCVDHLSRALSGVHLDGMIPRLDHSFALFADNFSERAIDLKMLLGLADTVYVAIPPREEWLGQRFSASLEEFLRATHTGRVVPVIENPLEFYDRAYVEQILGAAPRSVLPGELRLRVAAASHTIEPLVTDLERRKDPVLKALRDIDKAPPSIKEYVQAANACSTRLRDVFWQLGPLAQAYFPMIEYNDRLIRQHIMEKRGISLSERVLEMTTAYRNWLIVHALRTDSVVHELDPLVPYWDLFYGRSLAPPLFALSEKVGWLLVRLGVLKHGHDLAEQASVLLDSKTIKSVRELLESPRLRGQNWKQEFLAIEGEERRLRGRLSQVSWGLWALGLASLAAGQALGLVVPFAFEALKKLAEVPPVEVGMKEILSRPTSEARLLFKIRSS